MIYEVRFEDYFGEYQVEKFETEKELVDFILEQQTHWGNYKIGISK